MKFSIERQTLLIGLQKVQNIVSSKLTLPVLGNVLIESLNTNKLRLTTTDLEMSVSCQIDAKVEETGASTLPARRLTSIVRELPSVELDFSFNSKDIAEVKAGSSYFKILGLPKEEFPPIEELKEGIELNISCTDIAQGLNSTSYAASTDELRYILNSVLLNYNKNKLTFVATDARRLALLEINTKNTSEEETQIIIPSKAINEIQRFASGDGDLKIIINEGKISVKNLNDQLISKTIDGNYPNYQLVTAGETDERITIEREELLARVRRVSLIANEELNTVNLKFSKNLLEISSNNPDFGEANETMAINYKGEEFDMMFNANFLMAPLKNLGDEEIYFNIKDEKSQCHITTKDSFIYVIMPITLDQE